MAELTWFGARDQSFTNVENWRTAVGATPGVAPAATDSLFWTRHARFPCAEDLDQAAKNFAALVIEPSYQFDLGTGQAPLKCSADALSVTSSGAVFLEKGSGVFDDITILGGFLGLRNPNNASGVIRLLAGTLRVDGSGTRVLGDLTVDGPSRAFITGTLTVLRLNAGDVTLADGSTLTTATIEAGILRWHGDTLTTLTQNGGTVMDNSDAPPATHVQQSGLYSFAHNTHGGVINLNSYTIYGGEADLRTGHGNIGTSGGTLTLLGRDVVLRIDPRRTLTLGAA